MITGLNNLFFIENLNYRINYKSIILVVVSNKNVCFFFTEIKFKQLTFLTEN